MLVIPLPVRVWSRQVGRGGSGMASNGGSARESVVFFPLWPRSRNSATSEGTDAERGPVGGPGPGLPGTCKAPP